MSNELTEAKDLNTSTERLKQILFSARKRDQADILKALVENPNSPFELIWGIAIHHPESFFKNPSTLTFLKTKDFSSYLDCYTLLALVSKATRVGASLTEIWEFLAVSPSSQLRQMTALSAELPEEFFGVFGEDKDTLVRWNVAANPRVPFALLQSLAGDESIEVREGVLWNPHATPELITKIYQTHPKAADPKSTIQLYMSIAKHLATPQNLLDVLSAHKSLDVVEVVAQNPKTRLQTLSSLAAHPKMRVRAKVAHNASTPPSLLEVLARDSEVEVRCVVAEQPKTSAEVLQYMAEHDSGERVNAKRRPSYCLARNPNTPVIALRLLSRFRDNDILVAIAGNPNTPTALLEEIAKKPPEYVSKKKSISSFWQALIKHPNVSKELLKYMCFHKEIPRVLRTEAQQAFIKG